jgi:uncharacterized repeat protein (TIGR01451 family)
MEIRPERLDRTLDTLTPVLVAGLILALVPSIGTAQDLEIRWFTVDGGGGMTSSGGTFTVGGTIGQPDAGTQMTGGVFIVTGGFWGSGGSGDLADLVIVKTESADPVVPGTTFSYQLAVSNTGPGPASNLTVTDTLPAEVAYVSVTGTSWNCSESGGIVTCTLPDLSPGDAPAITIGVTAPGGAGTLLNAASVTASTGDPDTANNTDDEATTILAAADLSISNWGDPGPVPPGAPVSYTLEVSNTGPDDAASVSVEDTLPSGSNFQSASGAGWSCSEAGGTVNCDLSSVASGATADPITVVIIPPDVSGLMTNWAFVDSATFDPAMANNADNATTEVDATPPRVASIGSVAGTGDSALTHGESTRAALTQLIAVFTEEVADPAGNTDPDDVTNPANFVLAASGGDRHLATTSCATGVDPTDLAMPVDHIIYDAPSTTAFAVLSSDAEPLPAERYRLLVCGSTSIVDLVGHPLDGNGDGIGGDDHTLDFVIDATTLLTNPNFDADLSSWTVGEPSPGEVVHAAAEDADGVITSGAAEIVNTTGPGGQYYLYQCVPVTAGQFYRLDGLSRIASTTPGAPTTTGIVDFFTLGDCSGAVAASVAAGTVTGDTAGLWVSGVGGLAQAPASSQSARVWLATESGAAPGFTLHLDNIRFFDSGFFADDFESGDATAWSSTTGGTP